MKGAAHKPKLVIFSGAGISAESGLETFRASNGLWAGHKVEEVATPEGFRNNPELVLNFYNMRRRAVLSAHPNQGHFSCKEAESYFEVNVITQNIDDLHERAGSTRVLHLHGEILKALSTSPKRQIIEWKKPELNLGDCDEAGYQFRPQVVWFGEAVPLMGQASELTSEADAMIIVGTSLQVYPAASLWSELKYKAPLVLVDPGAPQTIRRPHYHIQEQASVGMPAALNYLKKHFDF